MLFTKPDNPSTVITFVGESAVRIAPSAGSIVAVPIAHDWGPLGSESGGTRLIGSFGEFETVYGDTDTPGRRAVLGAFHGSGLAGETGAGGVIVHRMATAAAARATVQLMDATAVTPAAAVRLDAIYAGARGSEIGYVVEVDPTNATRTQLRITLRGATVEKYTFTSADTASLVAAITARPSRYVIATSLSTGTALATGSGSLAGGANGDSLTATEHLATLAALEYQPFSILAFPGLTDAGIQASVRSWVIAQAGEMRGVQLVVGGEAGESLDTAIARSLAMNDEHIINLGVGTYFDDLLDREVSTADLAPRLAGVLAARGSKRALTYAEMAGLRVVGSTGPATDELRTAADNGVTVLRRASNPDSELVVARGVTTFTSLDIPAKPFEIFREPRFIRIMDGFIRDGKAVTDRDIVGDATVTDDTRAAVKQIFQALIEELLADNLILPVPEPYVVVNPPDDPALEDAVPFTFGWKFARTVLFVIGHGRVR